MYGCGKVAGVFVAWSLSPMCWSLLKTPFCLTVVSCAWMVDYLAKSALVYHSCSKLVVFVFSFEVWHCTITAYRSTWDMFESLSKVTELIIWVGIVSWLVGFGAVWTCLSYSSKYLAGMAALTCWNRDEEDCVQVWTCCYLGNVPSVMCEKEGQKNHELEISFAAPEFVPSHFVCGGLSPAV